MWPNAAQSDLDSVTEREDVENETFKFDSIFACMRVIDHGHHEETMKGERRMFTGELQSRMRVDEYMPSQVECGNFVDAAIMCGNYVGAAILWVRQFCGCGNYVRELCGCGNFVDATIMCASKHMYVGKHAPSGLVCRPVSGCANGMAFLAI